MHRRASIHFRCIWRNKPFMPFIILERQCILVQGWPICRCSWLSTVSQHEVGPGGLVPSGSSAPCDVDAPKSRYSGGHSLVRKHLLPTFAGRRFCRRASALDCAYDAHCFGYPSETLVSDAVFFYFFIGGTGNP
jgi:hypothetical protein